MVTNSSRAPESHPGVMYLSLKEWFDAQPRSRFPHQQDAAAYLGITNREMSAYLREKFRPGPTKAQRLSRLTGVPLANLLGVAGEADEPEAPRG